MPRSFKNFSGPDTRMSRSKKKLLLGCLALLVFAPSVFLLVDKPFEKPPSSDSRVKEVGSYSAGESTRSVLLVPRDLNREELIALAREIHARRPEREFNLFDDDAQMAAYLEHRQNTVDGFINPEIKSAYPDQFVRSHLIGVIQMVPGETGGPFRWRLTNGQTDSHVAENSDNTIADL